MKEKNNYLLYVFNLIIIFVCVSFFNISGVDASVDYSDVNNRIIQNQKMYDDANALSSSARERYKDVLLKDMYETDYKGMTVTQQQLIQKLADEVILENNKDTYTDSEKLLKFHDWIKDNFYYYATPSSIPSLGTIGDDNPYYLYKYEYLRTDIETGKVIGKVRARCNGFTSMFIALARSQGIPARAISGYYYPSARITEKPWGTNVTDKSLTHAWAQAYVDGKWIIVDCNADCYNSYNAETGKYETSISNLGIEKYGHNYFDISPENLSKTHIIFKYRSGSRELKFLTNTWETQMITGFLNKKYYSKTNGKRINSSYSSSSPSTWFTKGDTKSLGDGFGRIYKLYWPSYKYLYGSLNLSGFSSLQNLSVSSNRISSLYLYNCYALNTVAASNNRLKTVKVTGPKNLTLLSIQGNPTTYVTYPFNTNKTAKIRAYKGGTVSVRYSKVSSKYKHELNAFALKGYKFKGWYKGSTRITSKAKYVFYRSYSIDYVAKFVKR